MEDSKRHDCEIDSPHGSYGAAVDHCYEDDKGRLWVSNGEYTSQVKFCPECGFRAANQDLTPDPKKPYVYKPCSYCNDDPAKRTLDCWHISLLGITDELMGH